MRYLILGVLLLSGCVSRETIVEYRCPKGQVMVVENRGTSQEAEKCYSPGVSYTDYRPLTVEVKK